MIGRIRRTLGSEVAGLVVRSPHLCALAEDIPGAWDIEVEPIRIAGEPSARISWSGREIIVIEDAPMRMFIGLARAIGRVHAGDTLTTEAPLSKKMDEETFVQLRMSAFYKGIGQEVVTMFDVALEAYRAGKTGRPASFSQEQPLPYETILPELCNPVNRPQYVDLYRQYLGLFANCVTDADRLLTRAGEGLNVLESLGHAYAVGERPHPEDSETYEDYERERAIADYHATIGYLFDQSMGLGNFAEQDNGTPAAATRHFGASP